MRMGMLMGILLGCLAPAVLPAQTPPTAQEDEVIAANRLGAKPRPVAPGQPLSPLERERARVFERSRRSVVHVTSSTAVALVDPQAQKAYRIPSGTGTGFVWDQLGHVVTNHHVLMVEDPGTGIPRFETENIRVKLADGMTYKARLIGRSLAYDVAVLHVFAPLKDLKPLPLGRSSSLVVGQSVLALGNPFGLDHTLTGGIVSALGREIPTAYRTTVKGVIQTDAAINPGNSGGPMLDMAGRLVGMNTSIANATGASVGVGFAIPADILNRVVPVLIAQGQLNPVEIGFQSLPTPLAETLRLPQGVVVAQVEPGSLAERAGLRPWRFQETEDLPQVMETGDTIVAFEGRPILNELLLFAELETHPVGAPFTFVVLREGQQVSIRIDPSGAPPKRKAKPQPSSGPIV